MIVQERPMALVQLANPSRFLAFVGRVLPWLVLATLIAFAVGIVLVLVAVVIAGVAAALWWFR